MKLLITLMLCTSLQACGLAETGVTAAITANTAKESSTARDQIQRAQNAVDQANKSISTTTENNQ